MDAYADVNTCRCTYLCTHTHTHLVYAHVRYGCVTFIDVAMPLAPEVRLQHETLAETMSMKADGVCSQEASACV